MIGVLRTRRATPSINCVRLELAGLDGENGRPAFIQALTGRAARRAPSFDQEATSERLEGDPIRKRPAVRTVHNAGNLDAGRLRRAAVRLGCREESRRQDGQSTHGDGSLLLPKRALGWTSGKRERTGRREAGFSFARRPLLPLVSDPSVLAVHRALSIEAHA